MSRRFKDALITATIVFVAFAAVALSQVIWRQPDAAGTGQTVGTGTVDIDFVNTGDVDFSGIGGSVIGASGGVLDVVNITFADTPYTPLASRDFITVDASGGAITITPSTAVGIAGEWWQFKRTDSSGNTITIDPNGAETIDGATTIIISAQYDAPVIISNGTNWHLR